MPRSYSHIRGDTTEDVRITLHGLPQRKKQHNVFQKQLKEDELGEQLRIPSPDPFTCVRRIRGRARLMTTTGVAGGRIFHT